jgi:hypothetical protein
MRIPLEIVGIDELLSNIEFGTIFVHLDVRQTFGTINTDKFGVMIMGANLGD